MTTLSQTASGARVGLREAVLRHAPLLANASTLAAGTLANAVLGFFFWWYAARSFTPAAVGLASAAISMMNLLGHVGEFGLGPLLLGHLPRSGRRALVLLWTALTAALAACVLIGLGYLALAWTFSFGLGVILGSPRAGGLFVLGIAVTGFTLVLDQALVGLLRSGLQMSRSIAFAAIKLGLLVLAAGRLSANEADIFDAWVAGQVISLLALTACLAWRRERSWCRPRFALLRPLVGDVMSHHALNIVLQAPSLALPFIVTMTLSAQTNAAFYAAWSLVNVVLLVPASLTTVVYTTGVYDPAQFRARLRLSVAISTVTSAAAGLGFLLFSPMILGLFSPAYPEIAGTSLQMLGFGTLGVMVKYHHVAIERLRGRMSRAALLLGAGAVLELTAATLGGLFAGLAGLTVAWLAAVLVQALVMAPGLLRALNDGVPQDAAGSHRTWKSEPLDPAVLAVPAS